MGGETHALLVGMSLAYDPARTQNEDMPGQAPVLQSRIHISCRRLERCSTVEADAKALPDPSQD